MPKSAGMIDRTKWISLAGNVLLAVAVIITVGRISDLRSSYEEMENNFRVEMYGMRQQMLANGTQLTIIGQQAVTRDEFEKMNAGVVARMESIGIKQLKKVDDIILLNTKTEYRIKDTTVVFTDSSIFQTIDRRPWLYVENRIDLNTGVSEFLAQDFDSLVIAGTWNYDKDYWWPKRLWKDREVSLVVHNENPFSRVAYVRKYKFPKKRRDG